MEAPVPPADTPIPPPTFMKDVPPITYEVVRETWLTRKPRMEAALVAAMSTITLAAGSLVHELGLWGANKWMPASREAIFERGEVWRAWTTIFAHADAAHLVSNSFLFFILSYFLYGYFGWWVFPVSAFIWGGLANLWVLPSYAPDVNLIGASGVVYWMGGTWLILYFFLSKQKNFTQRWLRSLGVAILIFMPAEAFEPKISYRTHLAGFALGIVAGTLHYLAHRKRFQAAEVRETIVEQYDEIDGGVG